MSITRRHIQLALGLLWLLDGLLQLQPFMFTTGFAHQILTPAAEGQPSWVAGPSRYVADLFAQHPVSLNSIAAAVQIALGVGFLVRRTIRWAVIGSIGWSLGIWFFGEGLAGLASAHASLITGAPGAAILYGLLAHASWPRHVTESRTRGERQNAPPPPWLSPVWAAIWLGGAILQMLPAQRSARALAGQLRDGAHGAPGWLASTDHAAADAVSRTGTSSVIILAGAMVAIGIGVLVPGKIRTLAAYCGAGLAALFWLVGQNLGQLYTGQATDPNAALLLIVFAIAITGAGTPESAVRPTTHPRHALARAAHAAVPRGVVHS